MRKKNSLLGTLLVFAVLCAATLMEKLAAQGGETSTAALNDKLKYQNCGENHCKLLLA